MRIPDTLTGLRSLRYSTLAAGLSLLTPGALFAQSADQNDVSALKTQMERMQRQYEERISSMESEMKTLESKANTGSILNTRLLTDANGVAVDDKGGKSAPMLDESFLKSLTRNFTFSAYVRAGVQVNGSGGGGNFNFEPPDYIGGRARLGNENDTYMELTWSQAHMLGDSPDVMDVSMTFTPAIRYVQSRGTFISSQGALERTGNDFDFVLRQAFLEMKNVFKTAPEVTFWGGIRFYDRFNIDPNDYFYLDDSGYGAGVENIDLGFGKLWLAYLGGLNPSLESPTTGSFYKHTFDVRIKDINVGPGKLMVVGIGNYEKGSTFTTDFNGDRLTNPVRTSDGWGIGGGAIWEYDFGNKSLLQLYGLFGWGATNFSSGDDLGTATGAEATFLARNPGTPAGTVINAGQAIQKQHTYRAGGQFIWNPSTVFSLGTWAFWQQDAQGYGVAGTDAAGIVKAARVTRNLYTVGVRPIFWFADNFAIQGQAVYNYQDNNRGYSGTNAFGRSGDMGVFTIAPTLKPKGGYFSRPELRVFATWAVWSNSLKGSTTPIQEGVNLGGSIPPYGGVGNRANSGWLFGTQVEWFF
ncbi:MAG TPA: carbohydrate porin [Chthoniobacterales bacterium]